ncbi:hypothetical protein SAMN04488033_10486 [Salegentibacter agarivorans]|uniref:Uncharacterized protein n=1 Tax=Salegentibacter agarivorans TaxID=345907 RepID=A0A1I2KQ20_9FLAO|nr:hypothetical protein SAMN04488033_10486 [Salegentibacter agarivorans]
MNIKYVCPSWGREGTKVYKLLAKAEKRDYQIVEIKISTDAQIEENYKEKLSTNYKPDLVFNQWYYP